jgi:hypothetical protein
VATKQKNKRTTEATPEPTGTQSWLPAFNTPPASEAERQARIDFINQEPTAALLYASLRGAAHMYLSYLNQRGVDTNLLISWGNEIKTTAPGSARAH